MLKSAAFVIAVLLIAGPYCSRAQTQAAIPAAGFRVDITFSSKAKQKLTQSKETVVVFGGLSGGPKPGTPKRFLDEMGEIDLGQINKEVATGESSAFIEIRMNQTALHYVDKEGPQLLINIASGRKSSKDNLLDCNIYEGPLKQVQGKAIPLSCKLIGE